MYVYVWVRGHVDGAHLAICGKATSPSQYRTIAPWIRKATYFELPRNSDTFPRNARFYLRSISTVGYNRDIGKIFRRYLVPLPYFMADPRESIQLSRTRDIAIDNKDEQRARERSSIK